MFVDCPFALAVPYLEAQVGYSLPLLKVIGSLCVWGKIGASQNSHSCYGVCHLYNTQIHITLWCHLGVIFGCGGGEGCWFFLHHVSLSHPCAVSQPSSAPALDGSQSSHPSQSLPPRTRCPLQDASGVSLWPDGTLPHRDP